MSNQTDLSEPNEDDDANEAEGAGTNEPLAVVGIGCSAGGLEALKPFFEALAATDNAAYLVVMHIGAEHKSLLAQLIRQHTELAITEVADGTRIEPNTVYINATHSNVRLSEGVLQVTPVGQGEPYFPVDQLLKSLADQAGPAALGVILSGTGSDGTLGLQAIKGAGGLTLVQSPASAQYDGMPVNAIHQVNPEVIAEPRELALQIVNYLQGDRPPAPVAEAEVSLKPERLNRILERLRAVTGYDFSYYKKNTIRRRVQRRLEALRLASVDAYEERLGSDEMEAHRLLRDLFIGVTQFFRDPEAFEVLKRDVVPRLLRQKNADQVLRVWVVGCSTGEEAYSLAMILLEAMEGLSEPTDFQVFATDVDPQAVEQGRHGRYPKNIAADVSPERLKRFFTYENGAFTIRPHVREKVVFAVHVVHRDPPFRHIDLLSCRNLLIYMETQLQSKVVPIFHYALSPGGVLFLGRSESIGRYTELFEIRDSRYKLYDRKQTSMAPAHFQRFRLDSGEWPPTMSGTQAYHADSAGVTDQMLERLSDKVILNRYGPSGLVLDEHFNIRLFRGNPQPYLRFPERSPSYDARELIHPSLKEVFTRTLSQALSQGGQQVSNPVSFSDEQGYANVAVEASLLPGGDQRYLLVCFLLERLAESDRASQQEETEGGVVDANAYRALQQELEATKWDWQLTTERLQSSNEELRSANEELQSSNEELQSANEELDTSREELQSLNEELTSVNGELEEKIEQLSKANDDMHNLLESIEVGTLFLDNNLHIKRFTAQATRLVNLIDSDMGRPFDDLTFNFDYPSLHADLGRVVDEGQRLEQTVRAYNGRQYLMRLQPYKTRNHLVDGVIITFMDVTDERRMQSELRGVVEGLIKGADWVAVCDREGVVTSVADTQALKGETGLRGEETVGESITRIFVEDEAGDAGFAAHVARGDAWHGVLAPGPALDSDVQLPIYLSWLRLCGGESTGFLAMAYCGEMLETAMESTSLT